MPETPDQPAVLADESTQDDSELAAVVATGPVLYLDPTDPMARRLMAMAADELEIHARHVAPADLYQQTVVVLGFDPLQRLNRSLTAERFGGGES